MAEPETRPLIRLQRRLRLGKRRLLFAAAFMIVLGYGMSLLLDKTVGTPPPVPHQVLQQAK